jgi:ATP-binding cassette subfamily F protein uup
LAEPPLVQLTNGTVTFGGRPLFDGIDLALSAGERASLVGRNGSGKSTLLKVMAGRMELDGGELFVQPGATIAYLPQEPVFGTAESPRDYVSAGLDRERLIRMETIFAKLGVDADGPLNNLSGGEARKVDLARALAMRPDVLLLDEPTNHLDLPTIEWLERELSNWRGALLLISHDRSFLTTLTNRILWIDRGVVRRSNQGFGGFDEWSEQILATEAQEQARLGKKLQSETLWLRQGISARRTRNQGRLRALMALREDIKSHQGPTGRAKLDAPQASRSATLVIEAEHVSKQFGERVVIGDFSTRIQRGARIGVIGPNGAGKTTLLKLLTGQLAPDKGRIRLGLGIEPVYFDQNRVALDPEMSLWNVLGEGNDQLEVNGKPRHVMTYLRDFLFSDEQAHGPVKALSGGERARLLLAKLFARPGNLIVLDEPTNDLDMDTLDLLQEAISDYEGTVLLVSHDRDFLDRVVTSTLVLEGGGRIGSYAGGYTDYLRQRPVPIETARASAKTSDAAKPRPASPSNRLTYKDKRELDMLPGKIEALNAEIAKLEATLADAGLYARDPAAFQKTAARLDAARAEHEAAEERWLELEMLAEQIGQAQQ